LRLIGTARDRVQARAARRQTQSTLRRRRICIPLSRSSHPSFHCLFSPRSGCVGCSCGLSTSQLHVVGDGAEGHLALRRRLREGAPGSESPELQHFRGGCGAPGGALLGRGRGRDPLWKVPRPASAVAPAARSERSFRAPARTDSTIQLVLSSGVLYIYELS
jgi:hypothetical protein